MGTGTEIRTSTNNYVPGPPVPHLVIITRSHPSTTLQLVRCPPEVPLYCTYCEYMSRGYGLGLGLDLVLGVEHLQHSNHSSCVSSTPVRG